MAKNPQPHCPETNPTPIDAGTMCRSTSHPPTSHGHGHGRKHSTGPRKTLKVLGLDGAKVHDFLSRVASVEIMWLDLTRDHGGGMAPRDQVERTVQRTAALYDMFLDACSSGPRQATAFLAKQHDLQTKYVRKCQSILRDRIQKGTHDQLTLAQMALVAQVIKSGAAVFLGVAGAVAGLFLVGPELVVAAGIGLGFDLTIELIKNLGPSHESNADAVVVGFRQTAANDVAAVVGTAKQVEADETAKVLKKTLSYPLKSSTFRAAAITGARLDKLLKTLGWLAAAVTLYTETHEVEEAWERVEKAGERVKEIDLHSE